MLIGLVSIEGIAECFCFGLLCFGELLAELLELVVLWLLLLLFAEVIFEEKISDFELKKLIDCLCKSEWINQRFYF
jgi:hypothetical protein